MLPLAVRVVMVMTVMMTVLRTVTVVVSVRNLAVMVAVVIKKVAALGKWLREQTWNHMAWVSDYCLLGDCGQVASQLWVSRLPNCEMGVVRDTRLGVGRPLGEPLRVRA